MRTHSVAPQPSVPSTFDRLPLAAWLTARRRAEPRRDIRGSERVVDAIAALEATGVPFAAKDLADLAGVRGPAVSSALRSARLAQRLVSVELRPPFQRPGAKLWLGASMPVPPGYRPTGVDDEVIF